MSEAYVTESPAYPRVEKLANVEREYKKADRGLLISAAIGILGAPLIYAVDRVAHTHIGAFIDNRDLAFTFLLPGAAVLYFNAASEEVFKRLTTELELKINWLQAQNQALKAEQKELKNQLTLQATQKPAALPPPAPK